MDSHVPSLSAARDALTGLPGLDAARKQLDAWALEAPAHGLLLVLSRLSGINLAFGRKTGDVAIAEAAARLVHFAAAEFDGPWFAARLDGGSFLLLAREPLSRERWELLGEGLAEAIARPIPGGAATLRLTPRIALLRAMPGEGAESLLDRLGQTMAVLEKRSGRRLLWADGEVVRPGQSAAALEADLLEALDRDEIEILFQPQFSLPDGALTGAEALARWNHPRLGRIGAGALFALADRADQMAPLSQHIAAKALALATQWPEPLRLSLNVTSADLAAASFAENMAAIVAGSGFDPARLTLEVTEQALIADIGQASLALAHMAESGVRMALDDFGAGFCNFRYLKLLPLHYLKLDRSMVEGITRDARDLAVLRGIVAMARALGLEVIAEGVEDAAQEETAAREGCGYVQGFHRARPMGAAAFLQFAEGRARVTRV
ncbi:GGDEF domain-containing protein [Novosphingobium flavum]|uniref:GGDEF domain-containing protein n=1 Tax=Novosphingobium flavum TaxID=1778672 RepID=A0A7X1FP22_9SPHN|nr:bifunctional diguanylate cyclase/phosphodiesterase [Novosphingobium flavum]MBC2664253.1 GGDEF domain-containing protein [Novosphingobium flavum]